MFDEFVEHATPSNAYLHGSVPLPQLDYEGFEPSPYDSEARAELESTDVELLSGAPNTPIFDLGRVQYTLPAPLVSLAVSSDILAMGLSSNVIVLIELSHAEQVVKIPITRKPTEMTIHKIFLDPSGRHLIITSIQGENWYLYRGWKKPRQLKSFKMVIESVAWNKAALLSSPHSMSTREFLIGTRNGAIFEAVLDAGEDFFKSQERYLQLLFSLPEKHPVTGIKFELFPAADPRNALIIVTTPSRIYQFVGTPERRSDEGGRVFSSLFAAYRDTTPKISELPGNLQHSELQFFTQNSDQALSLPKSMAWMTAPGIYHGLMTYDTTSDDHIDSAQLLPYPTLSTPTSPNSALPPPPEIPLSVALTEFHFVLLYRDRIVAICNLDGQQSYEDIIPLKANEVVRGLTADPVRKTYWVYTDQSMFELVVGNESRDVWQIYLVQEKFDVALKYAKTASQRDQVLSAQARAFFDQGRYFQAAQCFAQCSVSFEEVTLKFLDAGARDDLRSYLISRLERTRKTDITQRMMLATWLVEFYLSKCNELDDLVASESVSSDVENLQAERLMVEDDLRHFFETYKSNLDRNTAYELIQGHGRTDMYIFYATVIGDFERVIRHWILEEEWSKAIDVINRQTNLELYYKFGTVLIRQAPGEMVDSWLRQPRLDPLRLIPSLLQLQHLPRGALTPNHAVRYLNHVIFEQQNTSSTIHNLLITFHALSSRSDDDGPLLRFLTTAPSDPITTKPYYDLDYALRLCKQAGRIQPCVHIYSKMGLWENSVELALEKGDLELAKINADMPEDDVPLRRKLWLKIARYVVQDKKDIKSAMRFLEDTEILKIEDILPFFPDFVVIDDFKEEIAHALEGYSAHIDELKKEMDEATRTAESIKQDINELKNRFVTIDAGEQCSVCSQLLLTRQFYVFPCQHTFHADCLIGLAKDYLPSHALRRILTLQTELVKGVQGSVVDRPNTGADGQPRQPVHQRTLLSANFTNLGNPIQNGTKAANLLGKNLVSAGDKLRDLIVPDALASVVSAPVGWIPDMGFGSGKKVGLDKDAEKKAEKLRAELDDVLSSSCPLCESIVAGLDKPFVKAGELDTWTL
ncbi:Pep3/Vps18/deep orange family-domain-containing protein [Hygrophoropsis aurantiaca]|uniref:Pep3/Vps18/deep orange family-domain-containing protein n=1 Tax=Hygrophoropsis aurantiaca TaxID=72124 RepID=A0ACB8AHB8_9AGAM|nr:Pep3/Vps18/deep orange family-domain-containing protein [Hygrophoropsis aurantiaca]